MAISIIPNIGMRMLEIILGTASRIISLFIAEDFNLIEN